MKGLCTWDTAIEKQERVYFSHLRYWKEVVLPGICYKMVGLFQTDFCIQIQ